MKATLVRRYQIEAAHHLPLTHVNHKCHRMHGHTWLVEVHVCGPVDPGTGMVVDFEKIDAIWSGQIHSFADHTVLNEIVGNPTSEIIASWVFARIHVAIDQLRQVKEIPPGATLKRVVVHENPQSACVYEGDES